MATSSTRKRSTTAKRRSPSAQNQQGNNWNGLTQAQLKQRFNRLETAVQTFGQSMGLAGGQRSQSRGGGAARSRSSVSRTTTA